MKKALEETSGPNIYVFILADWFRLRKIWAFSEVSRVYRKSQSYWRLEANGIVLHQFFTQELLFVRLPALAFIGLGYILATRLLRGNTEVQAWRATSNCPIRSWTVSKLICKRLATYRSFRQMGPGDFQVRKGEPGQSGLRISFLGTIASVNCHRYYPD